MHLDLTYAAIAADAEAAAGGPADVFPRLASLRAMTDEAAGNQVFPPAALNDRITFVHFYTDFYFSRQCGHLPEAHDFVDPALLALFNRLHAAASVGQLLSEIERWAIFSTACAVYRQARAEAALFH